MDVGGSTSSSSGGAPIPCADEREHGVVHDLGNLIQIASSALRAISRSRTARHPSLEPALARACSALERAGVLVRQTMVRAHAPTMVVSKVPVDEDVASCLREIEGLIRWVCDPDIRLAFLVAPALPQIRCSRVDLQTAVLNLVINARDAVSPGGALSVTAGSPAGPAPASDLEISVADDGVGMTPEILRLAFKPYFTTKAEGRGSGLGLSMVRRFVEEAGGRVEVTSAPGRGTTVRLRLPPAPGRTPETGP